MTTTVRIAPACITALEMAHATANHIAVHLQTMADNAEADYVTDLLSFKDMLIKAMIRDSELPVVRLGIVAHGAQWLMYAVQNAASHDEPAALSKAREEVFNALKDALARVEHPL